MNPIVAGSLIGAGSSLAGGLLGKSAADNAAAAANAAAERNIALQKEFAQNGIRWKVEDAKAAGIHPLYALGASGASFSPVNASIGPDTSMASALSDMGQNVGRAVAATRTAEEDAAAKINLDHAKANLDGQLIDNQIKARTLQNMNTGPNFPGSTNFIPGQGDSGLVNIKPSERTASQPGVPAQEAGWRPDRSFARTDSGLTPMIPEGLSESLEDDIVGKLLWRWRNQIVPNWNPEKAQPSKDQLPPGYTRWRWSYRNQEWQPSKSKQPLGYYK